MEAHYINNLDFAKRQQVLVGDVPLANLTRLNAMLAEQHVAGTSKVSFKLAGQSHRFQLPSLHLDVEANLPMVCQRCLESIHVPMTLHFDYVISAEDATALDENDDLDWVESSEAMDIQALIEDELLIALPIAPVHQTQCKQLNLESGEKPNPFSVLKALKKDGN